jgi:hypothetical protein
MGFEASATAMEVIWWRGCSCARCCLAVLSARASVTPSYGRLSQESQLRYLLGILEEAQIHWQSIPVLLIFT